MSKAKYISKLVDASGSTTSANVSYTGTLTGSTGILNIGSGQLYKDASGNVGIGVTDFSSTGANAKFAISLGGINLDNATVLSWGGGSARPYITASKSSAYLAMGVSGTERMRIDSSGNVGIGTSSTYLSSKFTSLNTTNTPAGVFIRPITITNAISVENSYIYMRGQDNGYGLAIGNYSSTQWIQGMVNDAPSLDIALNPSGGNVGIGTSSPTPTNASTVVPKLVVTGSGATGIQAIRTITPGGGGAQIIASTTRGTDANSYTALQLNDGIGTLSFNGTDGTQFITAATITSAVDGAVSTNNVLGRLVFGTSAGGANSVIERMRIDSSGNVGIGVTPSAWSGGFNALEFLSGSIAFNNNTQLRLYQNCYYNGSNLVYKNTGAVSSYQLSAGAHIWYQAASGTAGATLSFTPAMTLDTNGNLGVGASSPSYKMHVRGSATGALTALQIDNSSSVGIGNQTYLNIFTFDGAQYRGGKIYSSIDGGAWTDARLTLQSQLTGGAYDDTLTLRGGNVGVGTTSPAYKLHVVSSADRPLFVTAGTDTPAVFQSTTANSYIQLKGTGPDVYFGNVSGSATITAAGAERMRINSSGDVGIGTVSNAGNTLRYLDIQNTDTGASAGAIIRLITNNSASTAVTTADIVKYKNGLFSINNNDTGQIALNIAGSNRLYINSVESMILRSNAGSTAAYDSYHTNINGMSLAVNRFTSSNGDIGDWPTPVLAIKGYDSNFHGLTMQTFGSRDDNAGYQTASAVWNIRLWNDVGGTWTTSNSSTAMEVKGPGPYRIQAGASNGVQLTNGATSWTAWSDENMKDIIEPITDALQKVSTLRTVIGKYKKEADGIRRPFLIAQDVEKVLPEAVTVSIERDEINPDDIYAELEQRERLLLSYTDVIPLLTASIKELKIIIDAQQEQINSLLGK